MWLDQTQWSRNSRISDLHCTCNLFLCATKKHLVLNKFNIKTFYFSVRNFQRWLVKSVPLFHPTTPDRQCPRKITSIWIRLLTCEDGQRRIEWSVLSKNFYRFFMWSIILYRKLTRLLIHEWTWKSVHLQISSVFDKIRPTSGTKRQRCSQWIWLSTTVFFLIVFFIWHLMMFNSVVSN